jgi:hypothetical protein
MKQLIALILLVSSFNVTAQSVNAQDVEPILQQMEASGQIDATQAALTREYMKTMDEKKWAEIQRRAEDCMKRNPAAVKKIEESGQVAMDACN